MRLFSGWLLPACLATFLAVFSFANLAQSAPSLVASEATTVSAARFRACPTPWHGDYEVVGGCRTHMGFNFGMDMGLSVGGDRPYWALEVSYRWLYAQYVIGAGGGIGFAPTLDFAGRVEWQVLRLGFAYWYGGPLSQLDISRDWDLVVGSALSLRLNKRCLVGIGVVWYAPNPLDVSRWTEREKTRLTEEAILHSVSDLGEAALGDKTATDRLLSGSNFVLPSSSDLYRRAYLNAWRRPYLTVGFRLTF